MIILFTACVYVYTIDGRIDPNTVLLQQSDGNKYDKLILTDTITNKVYLLKHNIRDTYFIDEQVIKISGNDTTCVFE
jgi:hypothetical protein